MVYPPRGNCGPVNLGTGEVHLLPGSPKVNIGDGSMETVNRFKPELLFDEVKPLKRAADNGSELKGYPVLR